MASHKLARSVYTPLQLRHFPMSKVVQSYRDLYRKIGRLPLDTRSLNLLKQNVLSEFRTGKAVHKHAGVDSKRVQAFLSLLDDILLYRKYKRMADLLDYIYKSSRPTPNWITKFCSHKYSTWKDTWPQVHLLYEFGTEKSKALYREQLASLETVSEFLLLKALNLVLPKNEPVLTPLSSLHVDLDDKASLLSRVQKLHAFVHQNAVVLLELKIHPLEVHYEPTRLGLPLSVASRENKLKEKINYIKGFLQSFRPLEEEDLKYLVLVTSTKATSAETSINNNFFRFMLRLIRNPPTEVSPFEKKYVWEKQLIPNERNIRFYYKQYVMKQFYVDEAGSYRMNPAKNFYE